MALPNLPVPAFPNIPPLPGVPPLLRDAQATLTNTVVGLTALGDRIAGILGVTTGPTWGIFDDAGNPVIIGDSVRAVEWRKEFRVSDYPVEDGGFETYLKVETPFDAKLTFLKGGSDADRAEFLGLCQATLADHVNLYTVVTPEATYESATVEHMDYRRSEINGAKLLQVDLWLIEVRQTATEEYSNTKDPSGTATVNDGSVQPAPVPAAVAQERALKASGEVR